jgi:hypothetical protein
VPTPVSNSLALWLSMILSTSARNSRRVRITSICSMQMTQSITAGHRILLNRLPITRNKAAARITALTAKQNWDH